MPRKKKNAKEVREEQKKKRMSKISESKAVSVVENFNISEVTVEELKETAKILDKNPSIQKDYFLEEEFFLRGEKNEFQKELDMIKSPVIVDLPDFMINVDKANEREATFEKIKYLLKRRFSLVVIADILETNRYERLDEIIDRKEKIFKLVEKYTSEESPETLRLFSGFKKVVGEEYSRIYCEQEERVKAAVTILSDGKYFKDNDKNSEDIKKNIEDIVSNIIDNADFNLACQIETSFVDFELNRAVTILSDLRSRMELRDLIDELITVSKDVEQRSHAYQVMDMLISGKKKPRQIVPPSNEGKDGR